MKLDEIPRPEVEIECSSLAMQGTMENLATSISIALGIANNYHRLSPKDIGHLMVLEDVEEPEDLHAVYSARVKKYMETVERLGGTLYIGIDEGIT